MLELDRARRVTWQRSWDSEVSSQEQQLGEPRSIRGSIFTCAYIMCIFAPEVHPFPSRRTFPALSQMCRVPTAQPRVPQRRGPRALQRKGAKLARARHYLELRASSALSRMLLRLLCGRSSTPICATRFLRITSFRSTGCPVA